MKKIGLFSIILVLFVFVFAGCTEEIHDGEAKTPSESSVLAGRDYEYVIKIFKEKGFTNIKTEKIEDLVFGWLTKDGEVEKVSVGGTTSYSPNVLVPANTEVIIYYHTFPSNDLSTADYSGDSSEETVETTTEFQDSNTTQETKETIETTTEPQDSNTTQKTEETTQTEKTDALYYSTNDRATAKKGNSGVFSYKDRGRNYDIYYIIDFDEGYVYRFTSEEKTCIRLKIESGDLNSVLIITYHDGDYTASNGIHFKWKNLPDMLIVQDEDGFEDEYNATDLSEALRIRDSKIIVDF